jgi:hypothetical protein
MNAQYSDHATGMVLRCFVVAGLGLYPTLARSAVMWLPIAGHSEFADAQSQLQSLVDLNGHGMANRLCVVGQRVGRYLQAYVYWPAENKLILWIPIQGDAQSIVDSKRYLDLTRDIVKDETNNSSTYMITRAEANETIRQCRLHGTTYLIHKSSPAQNHG